MWRYNYSNPAELYHFGVLGMKWGRRRARKQANDEVRRDVNRYGKRGEKRITKDIGKGYTYSEAESREKTRSILKKIGLVAVASLAVYDVASGGKIRNKLFGKKSENTILQKTNSPKINSPILNVPKTNSPKINLPMLSSPNINSSKGTSSKSKELNSLLLKRMKDSRAASIDKAIKDARSASAKKAAATRAANKIAKATTSMPSGTDAKVGAVVRNIYDSIKNKKISDFS